MVLDCGGADTDVDPELLKHLTMISPNESELANLTGSGILRICSYALLVALDVRPMCCHGSCCLLPCLLAPPMSATVDCSSPSPVGCLECLPRVNVFLPVPVDSRWLELHVPHVVLHM